MIHQVARHLFSRGAGTDVMDEDDTGQEMQKEMEMLKLLQNLLLY